MEIQRAHEAINEAGRYLLDRIGAEAVVSMQLHCRIRVDTPNNQVDSSA